MLCISVELLHGTLRATGADDTAITGESGRGEWPPSPARLFSALVAGDGSGPRCRATSGEELRWLERAPAPRILASPDNAVLRSPLRERYVVVDRTSGGAVQEYVGRTAALVRPGPRLAPRSRRIVYAWDDLEPDEVVLKDLRLRAARVAYFGSADSPARLDVSTTLPDVSTTEPAGRGWWVPSDDGTVVVPVPYEGFLDNLDHAFARFCEGEAQRRAWVPNRYTRYRPPDQAPPEGPGGPRAIWLRFATSVSGRRLIAVTEALRASVLEHIGTGSVPLSGDDLAVVTGHGFEGTGYQHAHFVALPDVGHHHARGRLHGAAVLVPPGASAEVEEAVVECLQRTRELGQAKTFRTEVALYGGELSPAAARPERWRGPSRHWSSATPVQYERFSRHGPSAEEVGRWCEHAGVTAKVTSYRLSEVALLEGAIALAGSEAYRPGRPRRPYAHLEVHFDRPVSGPLVLGGARQFGMGLMFPLRAKEA